MAELNIDKFGEMMDEFLLETDVQMLIRMEEGTMQPDIQDNIGAGPVMQFYILLHALEEVIDSFFATGLFDPDKKEDLIDSLLQLVKKDVLERKEKERT